MSDKAYRDKKPKRADFRFDGGRYWISSVEYIELWDGEYSTFFVFNVKDYETDEDFYLDDSEESGDPDYPLHDDKWMQFYDKVDKVGHRVFPVGSMFTPSWM